MRLLDILSEDLKSAWNWLVKQTEDTLAASRSYALRHQLVPPQPEAPHYEGLSPEEAQQRKKTYRQECKDWAGLVHAATKTLPECSYRSIKDGQEHFGVRHDYQLLAKVVGWKYDTAESPREIIAGAHMLQALVKNYFTKSVRRKRFKRKTDWMPVQVRSGKCFELGDFGMRRGASFYDCRVSINGLKIVGRLPGYTPRGRILEGVSLVKAADGWWASVKEEVPVRVLPLPEAGSRVGLDVGLDVLDAFSDGRIVPNQRDRFYSEEIARCQALKLPVGRLHLAAARHNRHTLYNEVLKPLARTETIHIERLNSKIGQMGSRKTSSMKTIHAMLQARFGSRVREVDCAFTSQDCSQCGFRCKETWGYANGPLGSCPACGFVCNRDVNAARNIAAKDPLPLDSSSVP